MLNEYDALIVVALASTNNDSTSATAYLRSLAVIAASENDEHAEDIAYTEQPTDI